MLVLTRKKGERVFIGDDIVVTVIDVRGDGVRIGFDAPRGIPIQRAEVVAAVMAANEEALATAAGSADILMSLITSTVKRDAPVAAPPIAAPPVAAAPPVDAPPIAAAPLRPTAPAPKPSTLAKPKPPTA